jgi:hypothetical protein
LQKTAPKEMLDATLWQAHRCSNSACAANEVRVVLVLRRLL